MQTGSVAQVQVRGEVSKVVEKIGRLAYRLDIPLHWRVHLVFTIAQLEPCPPPQNDPYQRPRPDEPPTVFVEGDTKDWNSFELEHLLNRRVTRRGRNATPRTEYLARWKGYGPEYDTWLSVKELGDAKDLVDEYDKAYPPHTSMAKATDTGKVAANGRKGGKALRGRKARLQRGRCLVSFGEGRLSRGYSPIRFKSFEGLDRPRFHSPPRRLPHKALHLPHRHC